jgi:hypothetical protein
MGILRVNKGNVKQIVFDNDELSLSWFTGRADSAALKNLRPLLQAQQQDQPTSLMLIRFILALVIW